MKKYNNGFMLAETLIVTSFVAGALIFAFIQFSNMNSNYNASYTYNNVEGIYALSDIKDYILKDKTAINYLNQNLNSNEFIDITNCNIFIDKDYCNKLFELENIDKIIVTYNEVPTSSISGYKTGFIEFIKKIGFEGNEKYRLIASFKNETYSTLRFGD